jgi:hypothetical protein
MVLDVTGVKFERGSRHEHCTVGVEVGAEQRQPSRSRSKIR